MIGRYVTGRRIRQNLHCLQECIQAEGSAAGVRSEVGVRAKGVLTRPTISNIIGKRQAAGPFKHGDS